MNHQPFSGWSYSQRFKAIPTIEWLIKEHSRQGRRSDLAEKREQEQGTCVQSWQDPDRKGRRQTTRDLMAQQLGISTATFSKYRSIMKLSEELVGAIAQLLDENRISFEDAYRISQLTDYDAQVLVRRIQESSERELKLDMDKLKKYAAKNISSGCIQPITERRMKSVLICPPSAPIHPIRRPIKQQDK